MRPSGERGEEGVREAGGRRAEGRSSSHAHPRSPLPQTLPGARGHVVSISVLEQSRVLVSGPRAASSLR